MRGRAAAEAGVEPLEREVDEARRLRRGLVSIVLLGILVGALIFAVPGLREVEERLRDVDPWWIVLAVVLELGSCAGYVFAFQHVFERAPRRFAARVAMSQIWTRDVGAPPFWLDRVIRSPL